MADKGIIFSAPMVRALLAGTKTQTRRLLPPQSYMVGPEGCIDRDGKRKNLRYHRGDRLYVREAFSYDTLDVDRDGALRPWYWADGNIADADQGSGNFTKPKPSIHMPRWASRLTLTVTGVWAHRLQDISADDCRAEGHEIRRHYSADQAVHDDAARDWYMDLWDTLHTEPGTRWQDNPWVVAVSFDVRHGNIDQNPPTSSNPGGDHVTRSAERANTFKPIDTGRPGNGRPTSTGQGAE